MSCSRLELVKRGTCKRFWCRVKMIKLVLWKSFWSQRQGCPADLSLTSLSSAPHYISSSQSLALLTNSSPRVTDIWLKLTQVVATQRKAFRRLLYSFSFKVPWWLDTSFQHSPLHVIICPPEFQEGYLVIVTLIFHFPLLFTYLASCTINKI